MPGIIPLHVGVLVLTGKSPGVNSFFYFKFFLKYGFFTMLC